MKRSLLILIINKWQRRVTKLIIEITKQKTNWNQLQRRDFVKHYFERSWEVQVNYIKRNCWSEITNRREIVIYWLRVLMSKRD